MEEVRLPVCLYYLLWFGQYFAIAFLPILGQLIKFLNLVMISIEHSKSLGLLIAILPRKQASWKDSLETKKFKFV